jgi:hypothetical protein
MHASEQGRCAIREWERFMSNMYDKVIERIFDDAIERAWEEAKLRDLVTLYYMWSKGNMKQFDTFEFFLENFYKNDEVVREMEDKSYFMLEKEVVETICNSPEGKLFSPCKNLDDPCP